MKSFKVPSKAEVSTNNQAIFDKLTAGVGFVPNLYATMAYSDTALGNYLQFQGGKTSFTNKEKEVINLAVSQANECRYCQSAHTAIGKMNGFTDEQTIELRKGFASWDSKLDALAKLSKAVAENKGKVDSTVLDAFFEAGYTKGSMVDLIVLVGDKTVMNFLHNLTQVEIDFPESVEL